MITSPKSTTPEVPLETPFILIPVTVLQAGPCVVTQVKTVENDGYSAVQVGYGEAKDKIVAKDVTGKKIVNAHGVNKAQQGHFEKAGVEMVIYGHLHGASHGLAMEGIWDGVDFRLVSADYLNFSPVVVIP